MEVVRSGFQPSASRGSTACTMSFEEDRWFLKYMSKYRCIGVEASQLCPNKVQRFRMSYGSCNASSLCVLKLCLYWMILGSFSAINWNVGRLVRGKNALSSTDEV